jgi:hypothetical protein
VHCKYIPVYIQQDATLHSLFISGNYSTCFGWYFHPSSEAHTTVSTASGICQPLDDDGRKGRPKHVECYSTINKIEKLVHLVCFTIKIYYDTRTDERQIYL